MKIRNWHYLFNLKEWNRPEKGTYPIHGKYIIFWYWIFGPFEIRKMKKIKLKKRGGCPVSGG